VETFFREDTRNVETKRVSKVPLRLLALIELANQRGGEDNITVVVGLVANAPPA